MARVARGGFGPWGDWDAGDRVGAGILDRHSLRPELQRPLAGVRGNLLELGRLDSGYRAKSIRAATVWVTDYRERTRRQHRRHAPGFLSRMLGYAHRLVGGRS